MDIYIYMHLYTYIRIYIYVEHMIYVICIYMHVVVYTYACLQGLQLCRSSQGLADLQPQCPWSAQGSAGDLLEEEGEEEEVEQDACVEDAEEKRRGCIYCFDY